MWLCGHKFTLAHICRRVLTAALRIPGGKGESWRGSKRFGADSEARNWPKCQRQQCPTSQLPIRPGAGRARALERQAATVLNGGQGVLEPSGRVEATWRILYPQGARAWGQAQEVWYGSLIAMVAHTEAAAGVQN